MEILLTVMWYSLIVLAILFLISGIDEIFFDVFYWCRYLYRLWKTRKYPRLTYAMLVEKPQQKIAIMVPCWHESEVIGEMLRYNISSIDYKNYDFFVGVYPNDPKTILAVKEAHDIYRHIHYMVGSKPGPTTKADNLNELYKYIGEIESKNNVHYDIILMHDSEDVIHPISLLLFNYLLPRKNMVQLPVFPLEVPWWRFTHWTYNDEFAELHTKDIIVREAIKGLVPSAGVSTGFSRDTIDRLALMYNEPFVTSAFTEDYDTALRIKLQGLKGIFVFQTIKVTRLTPNWLGKAKLKTTNQIVAARSLFPTQYIKAVRQKARWIMGISMQEWANVGWQGNFATKYTLFHDRKITFTHFVNVFGYIVFGAWLIYFFWQRYHPYYPTLQEFFNRQPWVWYLIVICTIIMIETLLQRAIAVYRIYGLLPSLLSIPRAVYGNIINVHALFRAYRQYFRPSHKKGRVWEKTEHSFPTSSQLKKLRKKLGNILVENQIINESQLKAAIIEQMSSGKRLGDILIEGKYLTPKQLIRYLAIQEDLEFVEIKNFSPLEKSKLPKFSKRSYQWLIQNKIIPIITEGSNLVLAIPDPSNEIIKLTATLRSKPYNVKFVAYYDPDY